MTLLHTTDLHFNKNWFKWISQQQNNFDVFCITGDFLDNSKDEPLSQQIDWIRNWINSFKKPLFICSGNHDIEELENDEWFNKIDNVYSDNSIKNINGIKFGCIPYLASEFHNFYECDVLLYHLPPAKTKTSIDKRNLEDWGDKEFYKFLKNGLLSPKIILCGHLHYPINKIDKINKTIIYNPGVEKNDKIPSFISLELK